MMSCDLTWRPLPDSAMYAGEIRENFVFNADVASAAVIGYAPRMLK